MEDVIFGLILLGCMMLWTAAAFAAGRRYQASLHPRSVATMKPIQWPAPPAEPPRECQCDRGIRLFDPED